MKRALLAVVAVLLVTASSGCLHHNAYQNQSQCASGNCEGLLGGLFGGQVAAGIQESQGWRHQLPQTGPPGPPTGTTAYPYYTLNGPRDFLVDNPPSLGN